MADRRIRFVVFLDAPGLWVARGLEHDLAAEGPTIGHVLRSATRLLLAHAGSDMRPLPNSLSAVPPAAQSYWNAFAAGTPVPLEQLGITAPDGWDIHAAFATRLPSEPVGRYVRPREHARPAGSYTLAAAKLRA